MKKLSLHPDDFIVIVDNGVTVYYEHYLVFEEDFEEELEWTHDPRWTSVEYIPGQLYRLYDGFTTESLNPQWEQGDRILDAVDDLLAAKAVRAEEKAAEIAALDFVAPPSPVTFPEPEEE